MPLDNVTVAAWVSEPPEFTYSDGLFHIVQRYSDGCSTERVMSAHVFMLTLRRAAECAGEHFRGSAEIISLAEERAARH